MTRTAGRRAKAPSFADELEATFLEELDERLRSMESALVRMERPDDATALQAALESFGRDAHSLKGGAQLVSRPVLARIAHALETSLAGVARAEGRGDIEIQPLFEAVEAIERLRRLGDDADVDIEALLQRLDADALVQPRDAAQAARPGAGPAGPGQPAPGPGESPPRPPATTAPLRAGPEPRRASPAPDPSVQPATERADRQARSVRVSTERLDALMNHAGTLAAARDESARRAVRLRTLAKRIQAGEPVDAGEQLRVMARAARTESQRLSALSESLEADLLGLRMVPLERLFREFPRLVRDLARATGKDVRLESLGWTTPMDRDLVEQLRDPVMHLLRNAVAHGIEPPAAREALGKPATGTIVLEARARAGGITIEIRDDGAGIDLERVRRRAEQAGLIGGEEGATASPTLGLIFEPGFSTADAVTELSGRGVGLDVVRVAMDAIGGSVDVASEPGRGTRFLLRLPLTLASTTVLVVEAAGHRHAVPLPAIERAVRVDQAMIRTLGGRAAVDVPGGSVILAELAQLLGLPATAPTRPGPPGTSRTALVLATARGRAAVLVDAIESERSVVLRGFGPIGTPPLLSGAAILEEDTLVLVLDPDAVVERILAGSRGTLLPALDSPVGVTGESAATRPADRPLRVLVVDDSITTRTLEKNILAAAGFDVALAADGQDALRAIRANRPDVVISDVDMPIIDGIALTEQLRANEATRQLPVILVTSLDAPAQRDRGLVAGADAYLTKQSFDQQQLLETIRELVG